MQVGKRLLRVEFDTEREKKKWLMELRRRSGDLDAVKYAVFCVVWSLQNLIMWSKRDGEKNKYTIETRKTLSLSGTQKQLVVRAVKDEVIRRHWWAGVS